MVQFQQLEKPAIGGLPATKEEDSLNRGLLGWRCSADRTRLHAISLLSGNLTGNSAILRHLETVLAQETAVLQPGRSRSESTV
jgi:hypothetical protein